MKTHSLTHLGKERKVSALRSSANIRKYNSGCKKTFCSTLGGFQHSFRYQKNFTSHQISSSSFQTLSPSHYSSFKTICLYSVFNSLHTTYSAVQFLRVVMLFREQKSRRHSTRLLYMHAGNRKRLCGEKRHAFEPPQISYYMI